SHTKEQYRVPQEVLLKKVRKLDPRTAEDIKKILAERKEEKMREKQEKEKMEKQKSLEQRKTNKVYKHPIIKKEEDNVKKYSTMALSHENYVKEKESKITW